MVSDSEDSISVVLVEDDHKLARLTAKYLEAHGLRVTLATDGPSGLALTLQERPDVVLLDIMLPGLDGLEVCRALRQRVDIPIIMVTARGEEADRVLGLEGGADDYIAKPFSARELLARVRAQVRRSRGQAGPKRGIIVGSLEVDVDAMAVRYDGATLALTTYEFMLLRALAERPGRVLSREQLVDIVRGNNADDTFERSIDVHISHLRAKLGDDSRNPRVIKTVRGLGYMLALERTRGSRTPRAEGLYAPRTPRAEAPDSGSS